MTAIAAKPPQGDNLRSNAAVLVTGPTCKNDLTGGVVVEPERYETVNMADPESNNNNNNNGNTKDRILNFLGSLVVVGDAPVTTPEESTGATPVELEDWAGRPRPERTTTTTNANNGLVGDFDVCREYSPQAMEEEGVLEEEDDIATTTASKTTAGTNNKSLPSYVLGRSYHPITNYHDRRNDESALFWFTYRCDFPEIAPYGIRSDAGWGCMLRSAQMLLGQALRLHYRSRDWKSPTRRDAQRRDPFVCSMLTWFADFASTTQCYYSLHNMVAAGLQYDKLPGQWYGPGAACYVLRDLVEMHERQQLARLNQDNNNISSKQQQQQPPQPKRIFRVHVASQGSVYRDAIQDLMTRESKARMAEETEKKHKVNPQAHPLDLEWEEELVESMGNSTSGGSKTHVLEWDTGLLLLVPVRLGLDQFQPEYMSAVAHTFSFPQSVGILGGRVRGARWFYGATSDGSKVFGLDPHTVQKAPQRRMTRVHNQLSQQTRTAISLTDDYLKSVHTTCPEVLSFQRMDPSLALGFYCRNQEDLEHLFDLVRQWKDSNPNQPQVFTVADMSPNYASAGSGVFSSMMSSSAAIGDSMISSASLFDADDDCDGDGGGGDGDASDDDFVMI